MAKFWSSHDPGAVDWELGVRVQGWGFGWFDYLGGRGEEDVMGAGVRVCRLAVMELS